MPNQSPSPFYRPTPATPHTERAEPRKVHENTGESKWEGPTRSQLEQWYTTLRGFDLGEVPEEVEDVRDAIYSFLH